MITKNEIYVEENKRPNTRDIISEDGKYHLQLDVYKVGKPEDHYWDYSRGIVFNNETQELLFDIKRNYGHFWYLFLKHPNGNDYMICGRDYHGGYNILDLTNKKEYAYIPKSSDKYAQYFCWIDVKFDEDLLQLDVEGCYWACPYEIVTYDFSDPTNIPLPELSRRDVEYPDDEDDEEDDKDDFYDI